MSRPQITHIPVMPELPVFDYLRTTAITPTATKFPAHHYARSITAAESITTTTNAEAEFPFKVFGKVFTSDWDKVWAFLGLFAVIVGCLVTFFTILYLLWRLFRRVSKASEGCFGRVKRAFRRKTLTPDEERAQKNRKSDFYQRRTAEVEMLRAVEANRDEQRWGHVTDKSFDRWLQGDKA